MVGEVVERFGSKIAGDVEQCKVGEEPQAAGNAQANPRPVWGTGEVITPCAPAAVLPTKVGFGPGIGSATGPVTRRFPEKLASGGAASIRSFAAGRAAR